MEMFKTFKIVIGVLLLLSSFTIFALLFLEPEGLAIFLNFSPDISAGNLGEAIAGVIGGIMAGLMFFIAMFILGIFNFIFYIVIGSLTLALKRSKTMLIIAVIISSFALFLEIRALTLLISGGFISIIFTLRMISDIIIIVFSIYLFIQIIKSTEEPPRV
ncbi:MAG: hypothetical protein ACTSO6_02890 [Promethearchaeota archaeon]